MSAVSLIVVVMEIAKFRSGTQVKGSGTLSMQARISHKDLGFGNWFLAVSVSSRFRLCDDQLGNQRTD